MAVYEKEKQCKNCGKVVFSNDGTPMCNRKIGTVLNLKQCICECFITCRVHRDCVHYVNEKKCNALNKLYCKNEACCHYRK